MRAPATRLMGLVLSAILVGFASLSEPVSGAEATPRFPEYEVKAAALYHLGSFVEWPPEFLPDSVPRLELCVLGRDPFGSALDFYSGRPVQGRRISIRRLASRSDVPGCQILFISRSESRNAASVLTAPSYAGVLTVSDMDSFGCRGGAVRFLLREERVALRVNLQAVKRAGLRMSSNLLGLAEIFDPSSCEGEDS